MQFAKNLRKALEWIQASMPSKSQIFSCSIDGVTFSYFASQGDAFQSHASKGLFDDFEDGALLEWKKLASNSDIVVDIGAYSGIFSLVAGKVGAKVISFEPNPNIVGSLKKNLQLNELGHVTIHQIGLGNKDGSEKLLAPKLKFHFRPVKSGSGVQLKSAPSGRDLSTWREIGLVDVKRLDQLIPLDQASRVGAIKIDAEGNELEILRGSRETLKVTQATIIVECLNDTRRDEVSGLLNQYGYHLINQFKRNYEFSK